MWRCLQKRRSKRTSYFPFLESLVPKHLADQGSYLYVLICKAFLLLNKEEFSELLTIVFFTHSLPTYLSYLGGFVELLYTLLLDWSFWSFDYLWKILDYFSHKFTKNNMAPRGFRNQLLASKFKLLQKNIVVWPIYLF